MMQQIAAKTILHKASAAEWFGADYNINLYKGCHHGCVYCDSRSNCYGIENFDEVRGKKNGIQILAKELQQKRKTGVVGTGSMSAPYHYLEQKYQQTQSALTLFNQLRTMLFPASDKN